MAENKIAKTVRELAEPVCEELGYELVDVEYLKEANNWYLRIYIDKPDGISIDDCEQVSKRMDDIIEQRNIISSQYLFEVCSPGLDRPLKTERDFIKYKGEIVEIKLYEPIDGSKEYQGELLGKENGIISISENGKIYNFDENKIALIRRAVIF